MNHAFALFDELKDNGQTDWQERFQLVCRMLRTNCLVLSTRCLFFWHLKLCASTLQTPMQLALSWDLNQFHREGLAGPPVPPFASMSNFIANQSKDAAASSSSSSSGQSRAEATARLLTDPSSYISFASEREYVVFFEFLLIEDLKARCVHWTRITPVFNLWVFSGSLAYVWCEYVSAATCRVMGAAQDKRGHAVSARLSKWYPLKNQSFVELCTFAPYVFRNSLLDLKP